MKILKALFLLTIIFLFVLFFILSSFYKSTAEKTAIVMSTPVRVKVNSHNAEQLVDLAIAKMEELDQKFSRFNPSSEVSLINQMGDKAVINVSVDTIDCLKIAAKIKRLSGGAFNIYYAGTIDLGGIGKGYAVEAARQQLLKNGAKSGMIDMRSSIVVFGRNNWRIGIQDPRDKEKLLGVVVLHDGQSLSTSGDYERGHHIIEPKTGQPGRLCRAVTVIGDNAAETDALSTALFVLGPTKGLALAKSLPKTEALIIDAQGKEYATSGFRMEKP
jgi:thiamine biosynthesis lipoprotein